MPTVEPPGNAPTREYRGRSYPGFAVLPLHTLWIAAMSWLLVASVAASAQGGRPDQFPWSVLLAVLGLVAAGIAPGGCFTLQPNQARVLILFGSYKGTVRTGGFHWANPFYSGGRGNRSAGPEREPGTAPKGDIGWMLRAALAELDGQQIVQLDTERRAAMVSNLLVVLCGNSDATPVINTGTLYG